MDYITRLAGRGKTIFTARDAYKDSVNDRLGLKPTPAKAALNSMVNKGILKKCPVSTGGRPTESFEVITGAK